MKKRSEGIAQRFVAGLVLVACLTLVSEAFWAQLSHAATAQKINAEVQAALTLFSQKVKRGSDLLKTAKGVLVIPSIVRAGFVVGGQYGEGALLVSGRTVEYCGFAAASIGLQIGAEKHNLILILREDEALKKFRASSGWKVGLDGSVAFIDAGAGKSVDTMNINDPIVAFLFGQKGLMANATIEGGKFTKLVR